MRIVKEVFDDLTNYEFIGDYTVKIFKNKKGGMYYSTVLYETDDNAEIVQEFKYFVTMKEAKDKAIDYVNELIAENSNH